MEHCLHVCLQDSTVCAVLRLTALAVAGQAVVDLVGNAHGKWSANQQRADSMALMGRGLRCTSAQVAGLAALLRPGTACWVRQEHATNPLFVDPETKLVVSPKAHDPFDAARPDETGDTLYGRTNVFVREVGLPLPVARHGVLCCAFHTKLVWRRLSRVGFSRACQAPSLP